MPGGGGWHSPGGTLQLIGGSHACAALPPHMCPGPGADRARRLWWGQHGLGGGEAGQVPTQVGAPQPGVGGLVGPSCPRGPHPHADPSVPTVRPVCWRCWRASVPPRTLPATSCWSRARSTWSSGGSTSESRDGDRGGQGDGRGLSAMFPPPQAATAPRLLPMAVHGQAGTLLPARHLRPRLPA